jgi:predicted DNA-binding protein
MICLEWSKLMTEKMVRTQVYLPQDIYEKLRSRADEEGITMAAQIREALAEYVVEKPEKKEHILTADDPIWELIGIGESGITDGSVNHDKYIYTRDWDKEEDQ